MGAPKGHFKIEITFDPSYDFILAKNLKVTNCLHDFLSKGIQDTIMTSCPFPFTSTVENNLSSFVCHDFSSLRITGLELEVLTLWFEPNKFIIRVYS